MKKRNHSLTELDKSIDEFLQKRKEAGQGIKTAAEAESIMSVMLGRLLSRMLEGEMDDHLGYRCGEANISENERNGHTAKQLKPDTIGAVKVDIPRDRQGRFLPRYVPKHKRRLELEAFETNDLGRKYPEIGRQWRSVWDRVIPFFEFLPEVRRLIYTTNAIESLNCELRKITKMRASFPNKTALIKLLYLGVKKVKQKWKRPSPYWKAVLRELAIQFDARLIPFVD